MAMLCKRLILPSLCSCDTCDTYGCRWGARSTALMKRMFANDLVGPVTW